MFGKRFFLFALCVSFVQVRGDSALQNAIERGRIRMSHILNSAAGTLRDFIVDMFIGNRDGVQTNTTKYIREARDYELVVKESLLKMAKLLKADAGESNKPQQVFLCIDEVEGKSSHAVEKVTTKLKSDILLLEINTLELFRKVGKTKDIIYSDVYDRQARFPEVIEKCKDITSVEDVVRECENWSVLLKDAVEGMRSEISDALTNHYGNIYKYLSDWETAIADIRTVSAREMGECLYSFFLSIAH